MAIRRNLRQVVTQAAVLLVAGAFGMAAVWFWPRHIPWLWFPAGICFSLIAGVVFHELGHILLGLAVRFQPVLLIAGPARFRHTPTGWHMDFGKLGFVGGAVVSIPTEERALKTRICLFLAGGALANFLSALAGAAFASGRTLAGALSAVFSFVNALMVWLALYPAVMAGVRTDGSRLLSLYRGGPEAERWVASFWIVALSFLGHRPSSWPKEWVQRATEYQDVSADDFQSAMILYANALDVGDLAAAHCHLDRASRSLSVTALISQPEYHIEAAFLAALNGHTEEADAHLTNVEGSLIRQASLARARAAREWSAGNPDGAARYARAGIEAAPKDWDSGMTGLDLQWLQRFCP